MSIVVCDPVNDFHKYHIPHLMEFYAANKKKHDLHLHWELKKPLQKVQAKAVEVAREIGATHVLFTEHDQWGYPVDGLDILLAEDKDVIGLMTYMRAYPFLPMCMKKVDKSLSFIGQHRNLRSFYPTQVVEETDLITWAFTLVKVSVFDRIEEYGKTPWVWDQVPTDSHFCQYCEDLGIPRYIHGGFCVNHGDLPKNEVVYYRKMFDSINAAHGRYAKQDMPYKPQNEEDEHGVVPYESEAEKLIRGDDLKDVAGKQMDEFEKRAKDWEDNCPQVMGGQRRLNVNQTEVK